MYLDILHVFYTYPKRVLRLHRRVQEQDFLLSGKFNEFNRTDAQALVVARGGRCVGDVSNTIQYFVVGTSPGPVKLSKARQWRIATLSEFEFLNFVLLCFVGGGWLLRTAPVQSTRFDVRMLPLL